MKNCMAILGLVASVLIGQVLAAGEVAVLSAGAVEPGGLGEQKCRRGGGLAGRSNPE